MKTQNYEQLKETIEQHVAFDTVTQGIYWESGKGCFIGCLAHGDNPKYIENTYGLPAMLTRVCESIFEGLPEEEAKQFFADIPAAVGCDGKDLTRVSWAFLAEILRGLPDVDNETQSAVDGVIAGMDLLASGRRWPDAANAAYASHASHAASAAAYAASAASAADAAAHAADAAAHAAAYASHAGRAATHAVYAAARAARAAERVEQKDLILKLMKEAE